MDATGERSLSNLVFEVACGYLESFSFEELVVAAHKAFPQRFCLRGFPDLPDSHKVRSLMDGGRGLVRRQMLLRVAPNLYRVPEKLPQYIPKKSAEDGRPEQVLAKEFEWQFVPNRSERELYREGKIRVAVRQYCIRLRSLNRFLGEERAEQILREAAEKYGVPHVNGTRT